MPELHLHLVSDSSGETVSAMARACLAQFEGVQAVHHEWWLVRTQGQMERVITGISEHPGVVFYTIVDTGARALLEEACRHMNVPCQSILDPFLALLVNHLQIEITARPGRQYVMDAEYFARIEAMQYTLAHDDGQLLDDLESAHIILVGVSRTSKTPTSMYLANRGFKCANYPLVPEIPIPPQILSAKRPLVVGLTGDPARVADIRQTRLKMLHDRGESNYAAIDSVEEEIRWARRLFSRQGWPVIDVTRRSIEEAAAAVIQLYHETMDSRPEKERPRPGAPKKESSQ